MEHVVEHITLVGSSASFVALCTYSIYASIAGRGAREQDYIMGHLWRLYPGTKSLLTLAGACAVFV